MGRVVRGVVAEVTAKAGTKDVISIRIKRMTFTMCLWWRSKQQWPRWLRFYLVDLWELDVDQIHRLYRPAGRSRGRGDRQSRSSRPKGGPRGKRGGG